MVYSIGYVYILGVLKKQTTFDKQKGVVSKKKIICLFSIHCYVLTFLLLIGTDLTWVIVSGGREVAFWEDAAENIGT